MPDAHEQVEFPWYGIRTRANHEKVAVAVLEGKGFKPYSPLYKVRRKWSDRVVETSRPLFPGYVFCRFDVRWPLPILSSAGVVSVVGFGKKAAPIDNEEIDAIENVLRSGLAAQPAPFLREGQRVRITRGPLQSLEGILLYKKPPLRLVVSVTMLQRSVAVEIDPDWIGAA